MTAASAQSKDEDDDYPIRIENEIVVTATRNEVELKTLGNAVTVLTREDILKNGYQTVSEAIVATPGIQVNSNGSYGSVTSVSIRGANSEHTLVLIDGVEANDPMSPSRGFDFGNLTTDNVERIEIIRGPQSTIYGSDAMGGIINIITRSGESRPLFTAGFEVGKYNTWKVNAGLAGSAKGLRYAVSASRSESHGFSSANKIYGNTEDDGWRNTTFDGKLQFDFSDNLNTTFSFRFTDARNDLDNYGGPYGDDVNYLGDLNQLIARGDLNYTHSSGYWQQSLSFSYADTQRENINDIDESHPFDSSCGLYKGITKKLSWKHQFFPFKDHVITAGYEFQREQGHSTYHSESMWGPFESIFPEEKAVLQSFYVQDQFQAGDIFFLTGGLRADHHDQFGNDVNYRIAPVILLPSSETRFHASFGTGFKAPSLYQLYAPATDWGNVGNPELEPEHSWTVDGGVDQFLLNKTVWLSLTGFYNRFENLIVFVDGYENLDNANSSGLELQGRWAPNHYFDTFWSYTLTHSEDRGTGEELLRRAKHVVTGNLEITPRPWVSIIGQFLYRGARYDIDFLTWPASRVKMDGITHINVLLTFKVTDHVDLYGKFYNLLNDKTEEIYGYGVPGFAAYGGIRLRLR